MAMKKCVDNIKNDATGNTDIGNGKNPDTFLESEIRHLFYNRITDFKI